MMLWRATLLVVGLIRAAAAAGSPSTVRHVTAQQPLTVLVTGATGRTGALLYHRLRAEPERYSVRAYVRSIDKARARLGCKKCDETEGVYVGNVSDTAGLLRASAGAGAVAIAVGAFGNESAKEAQAIEFDGVRNTVAALAQPANVAAAGSASGLKVVICSSMGTTMPGGGGDILFWKLNAEAYLAGSGLSFAIVKPCGLLSTPGGKKTLLVGHDDALLSTKPPLVPRDDVAAVMAAALAREGPLRLRFDLCSKLGRPPADLDALLDEAEYPWQR